jgi:hypothetical protein
METILAMGEDDFRGLKKYFRYIIEDTSTVVSNAMTNDAPNWKLVSTCGKSIKDCAYLLEYFEEHAETNGSVVRVCLSLNSICYIEEMCNRICKLAAAYPEYAKQMSESRINAVRSLRFTVCGR